MNLRRFTITALTLVSATAVLSSGFLTKATPSNQAATAQAGTELATTTESDTGYIRVVQASPDTPALDIYLDNAAQAAIANLSFGSATDFIEFPAKKYHVAIRATGTQGQPLFETDIDVTAGVSETVVAEGLMNAKSFTLQSFATDRTATNGMARLDVIHAAPDAPAIDVLSGGKAVFTNLAFGKDTTSPLNLTPDSYDLGITATGTTTPILIDLTGTKLEAETIYTIIVLGQVKDKSLAPLVLTSKSPATIAATEAANASPTGVVTEAPTEASTGVATQAPEMGTAMATP